MSTTLAPFPTFDATPDAPAPSAPVAGARATPATREAAHLSRLAGAACLVAASFVAATGALDVLLGVLPSRFGSLQWRFGVVGLLAPALVPPVIAAVLAFAAATLRRSRALFTAIAATTGTIAALLAATMLLFVLDAIQLRALAGAGAGSALDVAIVKTFGTYVVAAAVFGVLARLAARARRAAAAPAARPVVEGW